MICAAHHVVHRALASEARPKPDPRGDFSVRRRHSQWAVAEHTSTVAVLEEPPATPNSDVPEGATHLRYWTRWGTMRVVREAVDRSATAHTGLGKTATHALGLINIADGLGR